MPDEASLRALVARARNDDGGWPYYAGRQSRLEPTAWALIALKERGAALVLQRWRSPAGLLVEPVTGSVNYAFNALAALALRSMAEAGDDPDATAADIVQGLIGHKGVAVPDHPAIRQDATLRAWSWTDGTFSWVEPTAWCMLAVKKIAPVDGPGRQRTAEAERMLRDRACLGGGWNYGNAEVFRQALPAHVPPSALGVLAMQDQLGDRVVQEAVGFLRRAAALEGSTSALALAWIALSAAKVTAPDLEAALAARAGITEQFGNLASAAMGVYALDHQRRRVPPSAFVV